MGAEIAALLACTILPWSIMLASCHGSAWIYGLVRLYTATIDAL